MFGLGPSLRWDDGPKKMPPPNSRDCADCLMPAQFRVLDKFRNRLQPFPHNEHGHLS